MDNVDFNLKLTDGEKKEEKLEKSQKSKESLLTKGEVSELIQ